MGAATAAVTHTSITMLDPGDVAWYALGAAGFITVLIAGWTTANANLYRAGLAAQAVFPTVSRTKVTMIVGVGVVVAACFPFVYQNMLPLLTYAGLLLVPVGGIVFAEHHLFKRIGYTRLWYEFKGAKHNVPALITWAVSLVFGFGMNVINFMPFFYLFVPTWALSIVLYTFLAGRFGAAEDYSEQEAQETLFMERVRVFQEQEAAKEPDLDIKDRSRTSKILRIVGIVALIWIFVTAWRTLFNSPDLYTYYVNREQFYFAALWAPSSTS